MNVTFDWNEWFSIISSSTFLFMFLIIRKYFPLVLVSIIWVYNIALVATIDYFLIATPFKLYIFGDNPTYELSGGIFHLIIYPSSSLLFYTAMISGSSMEEKLFGIFFRGQAFRYSLNGFV